MSQKHIIPLFPLPLVVCPDEKLPLHIFEERYKAMIAYCLGTETVENEKGRGEGIFGVSLAYNNKLYSVGCAVKIEEIVKKYDDGRMDIVTVGLKRYRMLELDKESSYIRAEIEYFGDEEADPADVIQRERAIAMHSRLSELVKGQPQQDVFSFNGDVSFKIAHSAGLDVLQKQKILEMTSENARLQALIAHFEKVIPDIEKAEEIKRRVLSNGHFKNLRSFDI
ncbi:peptidase S16 lon domain protein [Chloroherpeton thalassium ATCC 35110]|uniref:Peptidase S16 lon domain protein n=1 Tax=Chloroherpeton thalassium (strain ATCC 35110 / GB-78) TaxID=517418 RepID=B3QTI1_CHLT3|nr:LON peptidase substrate-binding domain-containing protein [Chloroherpeton thalassium]ACF12727.1 peptidase S16 lon domain protein [Chloroherpeton thalassium ATCC 35110]